MAPRSTPVSTNGDRERTAGIANERTSMFRYNTCMSVGGASDSLPTFHSGVPARVNHPDSRLYSTLPLYLGLPVDETKPRRGRWGEILGTKGCDDAMFLEEEWSKAEPVGHRAERTRLEAKLDLQKRIEIALYGKPRSKPHRENICPLEPCDDWKA